MKTIFKYRIVEVSVSASETSLDETIYFEGDNHELPAKINGTCFLIVCDSFLGKEMFPSLLLKLVAPPRGRNYNDGGEWQPQ